jgi:hypothetical protein
VTLVAPRALALALALILTVALAFTACSATDDGGRGTAVATTERTATTIVVRLPDDWPDPIYPDTPTLVIEDEVGADIVTVPAGDGTMLVALPGPGTYRIGAITGGGCFDTAGVAPRGNPPIEVADGDTIRLIDTGEICD